MNDYKKNTGDNSSPIDLINQRLLGYFLEVYSKLYECVKTEQLEKKEILKELYSILREQFQSDPDSRCLIFVATRNCASKLSDHLKKVPELPIFYNKEVKKFFEFLKHGSYKNFQEFLKNFSRNFLKKI
ncbi:unnamed protein product [Meloidogyne enterolobii]|uniref:Uncharacterized protein n=1 Tax=Meloidogyne enterolobii TaxID=390850 RepID=A0ACB0ZQL8_MELEN